MLFSQLYAKFRVWPRRRRKTQAPIVLPSQEKTQQTRDEEKHVSWKEIKQQELELDFLNWPLSNDGRNDGASNDVSTPLKTHGEVVTMPGSDQSYPEIEEYEESIYHETIEPINLTSLPQELHLHIFSFLRPSESALLGLTCKKFYGLHWNSHGAVRMTTSFYSITNPRNWEMILMYHLLESWMGKDYKFELRLGKFVKANSHKHGMNHKKEGRPLRKFVAMPPPPPHR
ncbi:hypothetical protein B0J14DRAFT_643358 [Halenospora varia]|nr:hypothetical protein B0J14DRAFT_643358 [Halenospora varia]